MVKTKTEIKSIIADSLTFLKKRIRIGSAYLFGSYASGAAGAWSDIDLAVFSPDVENMNIEERATLATAVRLHCHTEVEIHLFPQRALREARKTNFYGYILQTGKKVL